MLVTNAYAHCVRLLYYVTYVSRCAVNGLHLSGVGAVGCLRGIQRVDAAACGPCRWRARVAVAFYWAFNGTEYIILLFH